MTKRHRGVASAANPDPEEPASRALSPQDREQVEELFRSRARELFRHARNLTEHWKTAKDRDTDAEDMVGEAFRRVAQSWRMPVEGKSGTVPLRDLPEDELCWRMKTIINNIRADSERRNSTARKHQEELYRRSQKVTGDPAEVVVGLETGLRIQRIILEMPPQRRKVAWLLWREGMSDEEISQELKIASSTVRDHVARAREQLKAALAPPQDPEVNPPKGGAGQ